MTRAGSVGVLGGDLAVGVLPLLALACCGGGPAGEVAVDAGTPADLCLALRWWDQPHTVPGTRAPSDLGGVATLFDDDLAVPGSTPVELRRDATLVAEAVYPWGFEPTFRDVETGRVFRFLHLQPSARLATSVGTVYRAGAIVGLSGGETWETGFERPACEGRVCSTGAHLCVQGELPIDELFPASTRACPPGTPGALVEPAPSVQKARERWLGGPATPALPFVSLPEGGHR